MNYRKNIINIGMMEQNIFLGNGMTLREIDEYFIGTGTMRKLPMLDMKGQWVSVLGT
jgi:hypothetical protein